MICERCGKEFEEDYRKYPKGEPRFCSYECSKKRKQTEETKEKLRIKSKELWRNPEYLEKMKKRESGIRKFTEEDRKKAAAKSAEKAKERTKKALEENKYENLTVKSRRQVLLEESSYFCEVCGNKEWLGEPIWLEIHHIDGNNKNNVRENLMVVCPNCHSSIDKNYRFRGRSHKRRS